MKFIGNSQSRNEDIIYFYLTIDYVDEIFKTMTEAIENKTLQDAIDELKKQTPPPMNTMLDKQLREEAIAKKKARDSMTLVNVPPTNPGNNKNKHLTHQS